MIGRGSPGILHHSRHQAAPMSMPGRRVTGKPYRRLRPAIVNLLHHSAGHLRPRQWRDQYSSLAGGTPSIPRRHGDVIRLRPSTALCCGTCSKPPKSPCFTEFDRLRKVSAGRGPTRKRRRRPTTCGDKRTRCAKQHGIGRFFDYAEMRQLRPRAGVFWPNSTRSRTLGHRTLRAAFPSSARTGG